jgi:hypothetical protein
MDDSGGASDDMYIVLSKSEIATVRRIQSRKPGECSIDWKRTAHNLKVGMDYLKAICRIPLYESGNISMRAFERAKWSVSIDWED